jgi:polyhydroxyalkanoate synthase
MWADYMRLWQSTWLKMLGLQRRRSPSRGRRCPLQGRGLVFELRLRHIKQSYLIAAGTSSRPWPGGGLPPESEKKVAFFTRQYVDALAPSNFLMTNPQVLRETLRTGGQNLVRGMNNLLADLERAAASCASR